VVRTAGTEPTPPPISGDLAQFIQASNRSKPARSVLRIGLCCSCRLRERITFRHLPDAQGPQHDQRHHRGNDVEDRRDDENRRPALAGSLIQHVPEGHQQRRCALCRVQHAVVRDRELPAEHVGAGRRDQLGGWPETAQAKACRRREAQPGSRKKLTCSGHAANSRRYRDLGSTCFCRGREGLDLNGVARSAKRLTRRFFLLVAGTAIEVISAEVLVHRPIFEHVVDGGEDTRCS
jgi:hypothetical protein